MCADRKRREREREKKKQNPEASAIAVMRDEGLRDRYRRRLPEKNNETFTHLVTAVCEKKKKARIKTNIIQMGFFLGSMGNFNYLDGRPRVVLVQAE